jgi:hypothetical protein
VGRILQKCFGSFQCRKYIEERLTNLIYLLVLEEVMIPSVREVSPANDFVFQQNNCSVHTARMVTEWFQNQNINFLDWPSLSPDLNSIENMWVFMVKTMMRRYSGFQNENDLLPGIPTCCLE